MKLLAPCPFFVPATPIGGREQSLFAGFKFGEEIDLPMRAGLDGGLWTRLYRLELGCFRAEPWNEYDGDRRRVL